MPTKHFCDVCGDEATKGYTVEWKDDIQSAGILVASHVPNRTEKVVCEDCWPGEDGWFDGLRRLVE